MSINITYVFHPVVNDGMAYNFQEEKVAQRPFLSRCTIEVYVFKVLIMTYSGATSTPSTITQIFSTHTHTHTKYMSMCKHRTKINLFTIGI